MPDIFIYNLTTIGGIDPATDWMIIEDTSVGETKKVAPGSMPISTATQSALDLKVDENAAITAATKTKITYDAKGLVTAGADLSASDMPANIDATKISGGSISNAEFDFLNGLSDNVQVQLNGKQTSINLTTVGSGGPSTLIGSTLNIPVYTGGGGGGGTGTVTSVAALTLGTTGTDLSSSVANSTTTPVITLNVPTASASNRGVLSSTDWSTFNNKQPLIAAGTTSQYFRGDKTFQTLDRNAVGLSNVANVDTTNASNIATGTLSAARLPTNFAGNVIQNFVPNLGSVGSNLVLNSANASTWNSSVIGLTGALTITFDASLPAGFNLTIVQYDASISTIAGSGGALINNRQGHTKNNGQYSVISVVNLGSNLFILGGDTSL